MWYDKELRLCKAISENGAEYPEVSLDEIKMMSKEYNPNSAVKKIYLYKRRNSKGEEYFDIYFYNERIFNPNRLKRFIIQKDYVMLPEEEREFISLCNNRTIEIQSDSFELLQNNINDYCPNIRHYDADEIGHLLIRLYYSSHFCARYVLYKEGLENIAIHLDEADSYGIVATRDELSVSDILSLPYELCYLLEKIGLYDRALTESKRSYALELYKDFSDYMGEVTNKYQWIYFEEYKKIGGSNENKFNNKYFSMLKDCKNDHTYDVFKRYFELQSRLGNKNPYKDCPPFDELSEIIMEMESLFVLHRRASQNDEIIRKYYDVNKYEYSNEDYIVVVPHSLGDLTTEAISQHNFFELIQDVLDGYALIVFLRKKSQPNSSFVTVEIRDNTIVQFREQYDRMPDNIRVYDFIEKYATEKGLLYDPESVVREYYDADVPMFLEEYLCSYHRKE